MQRLSLSLSLSTILPISSASIGQELVQTINARELHAFLESGQKFSDWIKNRIEQYGFAQDADFVTIRNSMTSPPSTDYHLSLDMAKELSMVERNAKGKEARQYFLACERRATPQALALSIIETELRIAALFKAPEHLAQAEAVKAARLETGLDYSKYLLSAPAQDKIEAEYLEPADLAARFNIADGATVNRWLATCGLQTKSYGGWAPTEEGKAYCIRHHWTKGPKAGYNWKWSVRYLEELLRQANWPL